MKIVSVLTSGSSGGAEFAAMELLGAVAERGHETVLLADVSALARESRVPVRPIDLGPKLSKATLWWLLPRFPLLALRLRSALRRERPFDALLVHFKKEQLLTLFLPRASRPICAWAEWGPLPQEFRSGLPNALYRLAGRRADVVFAISNGTRESVVAAGIPADKVVVLPNAVRVDDIRFDATGRVPRPLRARHLGRRIRRRLCLPLPSEEAERRGARGSEAPRSDSVHIVLAGSGETEQELRELARPLAPRVHFLPTPTRTSRASTRRSTSPCSARARPKVRRAL